MVSKEEAVSNSNAASKSLSAISLMFAGIVGATLGLGLWLLIHPVFSDPAELRTLSASSTAEETLAAYSLKFQGDLRNHAIDYGLLGLTLGIVMGLISGGSRRAIASISSGFCGAIGGALGGLACTAGLWMAYEAGDQAVVILGLSLENMAMTMLSRAAGWGLTGFGAGFGLCLAVAGIPFGFKGAIGGAVGGVAASMFYTFVSAYAFPLATSFGVIPDTPTEKIIWVVLGGLLVGLCIALATGSREKKARPVPN